MCKNFGRLSDAEQAQEVLYGVIYTLQLTLKHLVRKELLRLYKLSFDLVELNRL